jgi:hypothetical protein
MMSYTSWVEHLRVFATPEGLSEVLSNHFLSIDPQNHAMHVAKDPEISTKEVSLGSASPWPSNCLVSAHAEETPR